MPHVELSFVPEHDSDAGWCVTTTDDTGRYDVAGVPACPIRAMTAVNVVRFSVPTGIPAMQHDIELLEGTISGHVYDAKTRAPVANAPVNASLAVDPRQDLFQAAARFVTSAITGNDGGFLLEGMQDGEYTLQVSAGKPAASASISQVVLQAGGFAGGVDLFLQEGVGVDGAVRDAHGYPIAGASFTLRDGASRAPVSLESLWSARSDTSGTFRIDGVTPGDVLLTAHANGFANLTQVVQVSEAGATVEMRMSPEGRIRAHELDSAGKPVAKAGLVVRDAQGNPVDPSLQQFSDASLLQSDAQGYVTRGGLAPGHYTGEAASSTGRGPFKCDVVEGQTTEIEIHVQEVK